MFKKSYKCNLAARIALCVLFTVLVGIPACYAGGALTIVKDEKQFAPRGSYIPERRIQEVLKKVEESRAAAKSKAGTRQKEVSPAPQSPKDE